MNKAFDTMKLFNNSQNYQNRIVAFVDVMGVKNKMLSVEKPNDLKMYSTILTSFADQPFAKDKLHISMFSDCMYIIAEEQYLDTMINFLANFSYTMLFNRISTIINENSNIRCEIDWDCFKLRGGITYGKVFVLDQEAKNQGILLNSNIVLGPAVIKAYELESTKAIYPRIIADENFIRLIHNLQKETTDFYFTQDSNNDFYYLDFLDYMCQGKRKSAHVFDLLDGCINYIKAELEESILNKNAKLSGQLLWYIRYLESYKQEKNR